MKAFADWARVNSMLCVIGSGLANRQAAVPIEVDCGKPEMHVGESQAEVLHPISIKVVF